MDLLILLHLVPRSCLDPSSFSVAITSTTSITTSGFAALVPVVLGPRQVADVALIKVVVVAPLEAFAQALTALYPLLVTKDPNHD